MVVCVVVSVYAVVCVFVVSGCFFVKSKMASGLNFCFLCFFLCFSEVWWGWVYVGGGVFFFFFFSFCFFFFFFFTCELM